MTERRIVRTAEAARYVGLAASTLEKMRLDRIGPEWVRLGERAVGYDVAALDTWLDEQRSTRTTGGVERERR
jgi:predicted DNA-binding transcriptional regulator AlpA